MTSRFRVIGHFETSAPNDPKMTWNTTRREVHHIPVCITTVPESQISVSFTLPPVYVYTGHIEIGAQNDPKMTLDATRSKVPHISITRIPKSQFSVSFALRPAVFELQDILRIAH